MASLDRHDFEARNKRLLRKHTNMAGGYRTKVRSDGLIVVQPKRMSSPISGRSLMIFLGAFFVFKAFLIADLGAAAYDERVAQLWAGNAVEQIGSYLMWADPFSSFIASEVGPYIWFGV
jgi:hypothetical protein